MARTDTPPTAQFRLFATCPRNLEQLLAEELLALGATAARAVRAGVLFDAGIEAAYRTCLWSRLASRVLLAIGHFPASSPEGLYEAAASVPWEEHLSARETLAVFVTAAGRLEDSPAFLALKVKDGVVDRMRRTTGARPSVDPQRPDIRLVVHLDRGESHLYLDLSGESLHRRHYREEGLQGEAPLKENLAAAVLIRAGWPQAAAERRPFLDPMCGSGTLPIEAALLAADIAPGLLRPRFGFDKWRGHQHPLWRGLLSEAEGRRRAGLERLGSLTGYDSDPRSIRLSLANLDRAGLHGRVHFERRALEELSPPPSAREPGLLVVNAPYGRRLGEATELGELYSLLGERLRGRFGGWRAGLLTGDDDLARRTKLRADRFYHLYNGALPVKLFLFRLGEAFSSGPPGPPSVADQPAVPRPVIPRDRTPAGGAGEGGGGGMFANRLRKNLRHLRRWAAREGVSCYRLYDADIPEYALAVDLYERWAHVQEYEPPRTVDPERAAARLAEALAAVPEVLDIPPQNVFVKVRRRQRGDSQYERLAGEGRFYEVGEGGLRFLVNFTDYLDTGLFLDHRPTRALLRSMASGSRFLNLFGYTGTATVYAAAGGALTTTTVDLSQTYLTWARHNLELNGIAVAPAHTPADPVGQPADHVEAHRLVRADVLRWLDEHEGEYDLIFLDPPTFSTSKAMAVTLDIQRDHVPLLQAALRLLAPGGSLVFSNNLRRFRLAREALETLEGGGLEIEDLTARTIPPDFARNARIHNTWLLRRRTS